MSVGAQSKQAENPKREVATLTKDPTREKFAEMVDYCVLRQIFPLRKAFADVSAKNECR
jgi:hypothetical protein